ncbi:alginate export family protein [Mucilaginibacter defluvii]|uniref:Alginate export domain-containing protein n=1 Tax=Mucilaginibacter defluvii TaxID=1196019 RepID=A0ABP9FVB7_9SPHI
MYKFAFNSHVFAFFLSAYFCFSVFDTKAQLTFTGQLRPRTEIRDGYGTLKTKGNKTAAFISQRTRLALNYKWNKLIFQTSVQDVRLWGQDASTISAADGNKLSMHEAWAELIIANKNDTSFKTSIVDYLTIKIGRQELVYDDERLLGNLDWMQQGRRHDALVFRLLDKGWQADLGLAFNQHSDAINYNGTFYTPANVPATVKDSRGNLANTPAGFIPLVNAAGVSAKNGNPVYANPPNSNAASQNYKSLQYFHVAKKISKTKISGVFLADQFGKYITDSVKNVAGEDMGYIYGKRFNQPGAHTRITTGLLAAPVFRLKDQWAGTAGVYYQGGRDRDGVALSAWMYTASISYRPETLNYTLGWDYLSGNNAFSSSATNRRFDPLYGTPHKFWGYMDYFYAVSGAPAGGLSDPYAKVRYTSPGKNFYAELAGHYFLLSADQKDTTGQPVNKNLGTELDFTAGYKFNKYTAVDLGFSYMAATHSMEYAKGITPGTAELQPMWAYLQLNIKPEFLNK